MLEFFLVIFAMSLAILGLGVFYRCGLETHRIIIHHMELKVEKLVPYALALLMVILVLDIFFKEIAHHYHSYIIAADCIVIGVFVIDLVFKYIHSRTNKGFVRKYWLDIIAVFPFVLIFRIFEEIMFITRIEGLGSAQGVLHTSVEVEREVVKATQLEKEASKAVGVSRSARFARYFRIFARFPRLMKAVSFYEHPHHRKK